MASFPWDKPITPRRPESRKDYKKILIATGSPQKTPDQLLVLYQERGRYFAAVPESIFRMSTAAADDYLKAAAIVRQRGASSDRPTLLADCYINAARAFAQSGNPDEAEIYFHKAAEFEDLTTGQIVALLERGIVPAALRR